METGLPVKKTIRLISAALILFPFICRAEESGVTASGYVGGTIPIIRMLDVSGPGYGDLFSTITADDYMKGFKCAGDGATTLTVTANTKWKVKVKATPFTPIGNYSKPAGDLWLKIKDKTVVHPGEGNGGILNEKFTDFAPLSEQDQVLWSNTTGGDNGCTARIDLKIMLNAAKDTPGHYATTITYTIGAP